MKMNKRIYIALLIFENYKKISDANKKKHTFYSLLALCFDVLLTDLLVIPKSIKYVLSAIKRYDLD